MNKDLEKQIEEAANLTSSPSAFMLGFDYGKPYWQQGMYSEEEVKKIALYAAEHAQDYHMKFPYEWFDEWFEQNKKK